MDSKNQPKIMYDQSHFTPLYFLDRRGLAINDEIYFLSKEISGYAPDKWYLYTQKEPDPFFLGAYDQEALDKEAAMGFSNFSDKAFVERFYENMGKAYLNTRELYLDYINTFYKKEAQVIENDPEMVITFMNKINDVLVHAMAYYLLTQPQRFTVFDEKLRSLLPNHDLELIATTGHDLTSSFHVEKSIADLASAIESSTEAYDEFLNKNPGWLESLNEVIEKYGFLNWNPLDEELRNLDYIKNRVLTLLSDTNKLGEEKKKVSDVISQIERRKVLISSNLENKDYQIADIMGQSGILRFDLHAYTMTATNYASAIISKLQQKYSLEEADINSYYFDDILELIKNGTLVNDDELKTRQSGFLRVYSSQNALSLVGDEARDHIKALLDLRQSEIHNTKEVTGTAASIPDKQNTVYQGRAFVIPMIFGMENELKNFKEGDILVAPQTHPGLIPQIKASLAIITDEGGITCHAAIVAREMKKPCIIGTRLSTKIFKTGDVLEIDLKTGHVRKV